MQVLTACRSSLLVRHWSRVARLRASTPRASYRPSRFSSPFRSHPAITTTLLPGLSSPSHLRTMASATAATAAAGSQQAASNPALACFGMDEEASALKEFAEIPSVSKVLVREAAGAGVQLTVQVSQRNLAANSQRKFGVSVVLPDAQQPTATPFVSPPAEIAASVVSSLAPSGRKSFVVKSGSGEGKSEGCTLEVWNSSRLVLELVVPAGVHGGVLNDGWFSLGPAWSGDEGKIAYVAEAPTKDPTPVWGGEAAKDAAGPKTWKGKGKFQEDWGELYEGKKAPCLFVLDINAKTVKRVAPLGDALEEISYGQPAWTPDGSGLVAVAWPHSPLNYSPVSKRLGVVFCTNRPCHLVHVPLGDGAVSAPVSLVAPQLGACSPTFTPDGATLLFLSHEAAVRSGAHCATVALRSLPWPLPTGSPPAPSTIVPVVSTPASPSAFPGLYANAIPQQPFLDADTLLLSSQWRSQVAVLKVTLSTGEVTPVSPLGAQAGSWSYCGTARGLVVATRSHPTCPPQLMVAKPGPPSPPAPWQWHPVAGLQDEWQPSAAAQEVLSNVNVSVLTVHPTLGPPHPFEAITLSPKNASGPLPCVLVPHGGPHSALPVFFFMPYLLLLRAGYALLGVNYRGSTGFGEDALQALPGNIGSYDVGDCIDALDAAVKAGVVDPAHVCVIGGSHGGFLTGHLLGQHPSRFRCGVMRNPVCNLAHMTGTTDIMDWVYIEAYGSEEGRKRFQGQLPTPEELRHFYSVSPAAHMDAITAPVAFMLGAKDLRVPLSDGKQFAAALQSRGVDTHVVVFPEDTHALDKPQTEYEQWLTALWWLKKSGMP